jgi:hemerythrin superfamily protein
MGLGIASALRRRMPPTEMLNVLDVLTEQHDEIDDLIGRLEDGGDDRDETFPELADKLAAHATVEEKVFYPGVFSDHTKDQLHEAVEEHLAIKRLLADMLQLDTSDDDGAEEFDAKLAVLKEEVTHHARQEEEGKLFPKLRRELSADTLAALANEVVAMYEDLLTTEPRRELPAEIDEAARLPA